MVVRRPPLGHVLATAHDMKREHRVISALHPTAVPVPCTVLLCEDESVLGAPFYVMDFVEGTPYRTAGNWSRSARSAPGRRCGLVDMRARSSSCTPWTRPGWASRTSAARRVPGPFSCGAGGSSWTPPATASCRASTSCTRHSAANCPTPRGHGIHGDYRLDNVLLGDDDRITAILDWEMSTLGDPLTDVGLLVMYSVPLGTPHSPVSTTAEAAGHPEPAELIERYARLSGRDLAAVSWYTAFAWFKLAVILEGIHYRYTLGRTVGPGFDRIGALVPVFIEHGLTTLQEG
ncbi:phosphotransferase family protein [Streptomyces sp. T1317-0309]|nr:phosphotransferase family protein [Streptomyces sp. T1317-0309]